MKKNQVRKTKFDKKSDYQGLIACLDIYVEAKRKFEKKVKRRKTKKVARTCEWIDRDVSKCRPESVLVCSKY